jgi:molybdate transport system regulatory protein
MGYSFAMAKMLKAAIKIDFGNGVRLGPGKVALLAHIREMGSISAAARKMDMSYRRAWLLIDEMNSSLAAPVLLTSSGGAGGGGAQVTEHGLHVISVFAELQEAADALVKAKAASL